MKFKPMRIQSCLENGRAKVRTRSGKIGKAGAQEIFNPFRIVFVSFARLRKLVALALLSVAFSWSALSVAGQSVTNSFHFTDLSLEIPDMEPANYSGVQDTREISMAYDLIESVSVTLNIQGTGSGAFNGDLYAYLAKGDDIAILLNRPGRTSDNLSGYGDNGLDVHFADDALNGDIHVYRMTLFGSHHTPLELGEQLTGIWAPDGRHVAPVMTLDTHPRTHTLNVFTETDPNGEWTLFIADMEPGGTAVLTSWGLHIKAVPEPGTTVLFIFGSILVAVWRWRKKT